MLSAFFSYLLPLVSCLGPALPQGSSAGRRQTGGAGAGGPGESWFCVARVRSARGRCGAWVALGVVAERAGDQGWRRSKMGSWPGRRAAISVRTAAGPGL